MEYIKPQLRDVLVDIAQMEEFENCNWRDAAKAVVAGGIMGCVGGLVGGPKGCAIVGGLGLVGGGLAYAATCWW